MTLQPTVHEYHQTRMQEIARDYRKRGYEVIIKPTSSQLPPDLANFQIDMLARNAEENVVIEVRTHGSLTATPKLDAIARALQDKPGWRFDLVVSNPRDRDSVYFKDAISLEQADIVARLDEARELSDQEHGEAALLLAWSATEALLRYIADSEGIQIVGHNANQAAKTLFAAGVLDKTQYQTLQAGWEARNLVVHGYKERNLLFEAVEQLLHIVGQMQQKYQPI